MCLPLKHPSVDQPAQPVGQLFDPTGVMMYVWQNLIATVVIKIWLVDGCVFYYESKNIVTYSRNSPFVSHAASVTHLPSSSFFPTFLLSFSSLPICFHTVASLHWWLVEKVTRTYAKLTSISYLPHGFVRLSVSLTVCQFVSPMKNSEI